MISYTAELHNTWTVDGFELGIHRIKPKNDGAKPVFLMHGLFTDAMCWVANLPINDLAFMLSDSGYDVWIGEFLIIKTGNRKKGNARGTKYSSTNSRLSSDTEEYWDWSWPEMGAIDVVTMVNYVLNYTGYSQISLVCHSEGCSDSLAALSSYPVFADKVGFFMALGQ